jgi:WD40 repeat protein
MELSFHNQLSNERCFLNESSQQETSTIATKSTTLISENENILLNEYKTESNSKNHSSIPNQISSLVNLLPKVIEASTATAIQMNDQKQSGLSSTSSLSSPTQIPMELKTRLYSIFNQIEREFDLLYAENVRLQRQVNNKVHRVQLSNEINEAGKVDFNTANSSSPPSINQNDSAGGHSSTSSSSSPPLVSLSSSSRQQKEVIKTSPLTSTHKDEFVGSGHSQSHHSQTQVMTNSTHTTPQFESRIASGNFIEKTAHSLTSHLHSTAVNALATTSLSAKSALLSSKSRINNLSFPKFKPTAKEFIMQSIKNTSAQIVNKQPNSPFTNSKLQLSLQGHKDGVWDLSCLQIPNDLFNSHVSQHISSNYLIGSASADTTARLWYLNKTNGVSSSFCIQEYCGHSGSVNSIRFHPRYFTDSTNLILSASGDCQAHIWQCVLSPTNDSLENKCDILLNYNSFYSMALKSINSQTSNGQPNANHHNIISSPSSNCNQNSENSLSTSQDFMSIIRSPIKRYEGHSDACIAAEWFPDGELLATASWDRTANVYNVETGKVLCNLQHDDYLTNVSIHKMHKIILTSSKDTTFKVWDFRDPICSVNVYQGHNRSVNSAIFISDDKIATSSDDQTVKVWDLRIMRSPVSTINANSGINRICSMNFPSNDGLTNDIYLCLPLDNRDIKIYNLNGERTLRMPRTSKVGHRRLVTSVACHENFIFSASFDKLVNCWSFDYQQPSISHSQSNKFHQQHLPANSSQQNKHTNSLINNKENNNNLNDPSTSSYGNINSDQQSGNSPWHAALLRTSTSPQSPSIIHTVSSPMNASNPPLNHITNSNGKTSKSIKLIEKMKI